MNREQNMIETLRDGMRSLREENTDLQARITELEETLAFHPRAAKLMRKRKNFVVVAEDEIYYADVYLNIRIHERQNGTWTDEDEEKFLAAWNAYYAHRPPSTPKGGEG